jgi:hypothetical protein
MILESTEITEQIIGAAFEVHSVLGHGFLEKVYKLAMQVELTSRKLKAETESRIEELKVAKEYQPADEAQLLNELKATAIKVGLLINFGRTKVEFKRFVY